MPSLIDLILQGSPVERHRPWLSAVVDQTGWVAAAGALADGHWTLLGLWGEANAVHMALLEEPTATVGIIRLQDLEDGYPSIARYHPPALRLERALRDLAGLEPQGIPDPRPWLDHGRWGLRSPLGRRSDVQPISPPYEFLPAEGAGLHQIPVGPVHAGIIEPGHFRFTASGETVVRLEERLGYVHKGIEALMAGVGLDRAVRVAGRTSGDSTVAYAFAFSRAAESALEIEVPPRALWLRALMAELERLANHLGDIGAICNDAAFALMHAHCSMLRERVLRAADSAFGHRMMRDKIVPGGVTTDLNDAGALALQALITEIRQRFPPLVELYDNTASLQDRTVGTGVLKPDLARQYGAGGYVGRASGRSFDVRRTLCYPPYDHLRFEVPVLKEGDVNARIWIRIREVEQSLSLVEQMLEQLPDGPVRAGIPDAHQPREGLAIVEGFRGDILVWLRLVDDGRIDRCHLRDPSWFQWPLLEAVIEGNIVADFPLCNKSFNCSYSGHDL
ncbi:Ni,Fe-hydrogenase III large subunit [Phyllobacterium trifolii]|uniref:Ni,Fe-hydrogenase III large subunit n=1 Tax=Phyllobacterium trifolii TaxID=300193 RepID=A0A839U9V1_9HYPH|nr:NADH-quinone oxidoreductase subunit C [Phyllobacterium trifolii]MBB3146714.1 Ni,Fe-hydrogenase III large subunit [Phyllobacterium trifolii]